MARTSPGELCFWAVSTGLVVACGGGLGDEQPDPDGGLAGAGGKAGNSGSSGNSSAGRAGEGFSGGAGFGGSAGFGGVGGGSAGAAGGGTFCGGQFCADFFLFDAFGNPGGPPYVACCPGPSPSTCGVDMTRLATLVRIPTGCVAQNQPGEVDPSCPDVKGVASVDPGCCRPDGLCGGYYPGLELGCVLSPLFNTPMQACGPGLDGGVGRDGSVGVDGGAGSAGSPGIDGGAG